MSKYRTFGELKEKHKEFVRVSKEQDMFDGLRNLLTELYPDQAHFIYELLQNAEDKEAASVKFDLYNDRLVFTHDGRKCDFTLDDIDSITNIGKSTKKDDPTSIGKFGVGFKAVYSYTNTPEIHSGESNFRIIDMLVPEDEGVPKTAVAGKTQFIFPFDNSDKPPMKAVKEISDGLLSLNENSILFLKHIHQIVFALPNGKKGGIKLEDKDNVLKRIIKVDAQTREKTRSYWYKFSKPCVIPSNNDKKDCTVDIAYKLQKIDIQGGVTYKVDSNLKGNVCIFFPAVKENSHLRFHINAPFASTVARDSVRDCPENTLLIKEIANLCVMSLYYLKDKHCIDLNLYATLPNRRDFVDVYSPYYVIYTSLIHTFKTQELILTATGEYKKTNEVLQTNREIAKVINDEGVRMLFNKSWIPPVNPQTNELYFLSDLGIGQYDRINIIEALRYNSHFFDRLFENKSIEWFRDWYVLLSETKGVGLYKDIFKKVKMVSCTDGNLYAATDNIYIQNPEYNPENIKSPIYVQFPQTSSTQNTAAKKFLEMLGVKEMSAEVDIMSDIAGKESVDKDDVILTLMRVIQMYENGEDISGFKDQPIFLGKSFADDKILYRVTASECCLLPELSFFYQNDSRVQYVLCKDYYLDIFNDKEKAEFALIFALLGGKIGPEIFSCSLSSSHPLFSQLDTERERYDSCIKEDYSLTGYQYLHRIPEEKLYVQSKILWAHVVNDKNFYHHIAKYRANGRKVIEQIDSTVAYWLKRIAWIPNKNGEFCRPCDITADDLYEGFVFDDKAVFLKNIGFGDKTKAPNDIAAILENNGYKLSTADEMFFNASESEKQEFIKFLESKRNRKRDTMNLSDALASETKEQTAYEEYDDYGRDISIKNVSTRQQKQQEDFEKGLTVTSSRKQVWHYTYSSTSGKQEKQFISEQYHGKCQICGRPAIRKFNGEQYFEAINVINTANLDPKYLNTLDAGWNTLCLCPNCAAEYRYCSKDLSDLESQVEKTTIEDRKNEYIEIIITLKGSLTKILFTPRHFLALKTAFKVFKEHEDENNE